MAASVVKQTPTGAGSTWSDPSPDPSGITYNSVTGQLIISDGEVEERDPVKYPKNVWSDTNLFVASRAGVLLQTNLNTTAYSNEPTGVGFRPAASGVAERLFVADDDQARVFEVSSGGDGVYGNANDTWTSFSVAYADFGSRADAEDLAVDLELTRGNQLLVIDAKANRVFVHGPGPNGVFDRQPDGSGDDVVRMFDLPTLGTGGDPEGIAFNKSRNTVFVLDDPSNQLYEYDLNGQLLNTVTLPFKMKSGAGMAFAPPSNSSSLVCGTSTTVPCNAYIVDRGVDNDTNQDTFNDGMLYEIAIPGLTGTGTPPPANAPPAVNAGTDQTVTLPSGGGSVSATLNATVTDDGRVQPLAYTWTMGSGPGTVAFTTPSAEDTGASFTQAGDYVLRLTANDGEFFPFDTVAVKVRPASVTPPPGGGTLDIRISAGTDDAEQKAGGGMALGSGDLNLTKDGSAVMTVGMRFNGVTIPAGATITKAYVQFQADEVQSVATSLTIRAQVGNAATFAGTSQNITNRTLTTQTVGWAPVAWTAVGQRTVAQQTPDLKTVLQQVVSGTWASGNSLALVITGTGERTAESFEGGAAKAPVLHIEYTVP